MQFMWTADCCRESSFLYYLPKKKKVNAKHAASIVGNQLSASEVRYIVKFILYRQSYVIFPAVIV